MRITRDANSFDPTDNALFSNNAAPRRSPLLHVDRSLLERSHKARNLPDLCHIRSLEHARTADTRYNTVRADLQFGVLGRFLEASYSGNAVHAPEYAAVRSCGEFGCCAFPDFVPVEGKLVLHKANEMHKN